MYNDFLIPTIIKTSNIKNAGSGRFFIENHKKGTIIREQIINSDSLHVIKNKEECKKYDIELLKHFGHSLPNNSEIKTNYVYINFPPMNTNHSLDNNIDFLFKDNKKITFLIKDVKSGEEILQNYSNFRKVDWFEDYLHENNLISARELGNLINN